MRRKRADKTKKGSTPLAHFTVFSIGQTGKDLSEITTKSKTHDCTRPVKSYPRFIEVDKRV
ncbi:hypothetical protein PGT21_031003 [Puccinia graminis f. sp. tritici]|uniref:Uncharacterized protein n=1 Tax=Puccinia graminis f. sp. tritici TaxID=56615 RepID=A0A5B0RRJ4_PUCGR|nr:hypothetical protein PGT21_029482 [Puccinia graminis f. sp. tritici]KAA1109185.1 hypothetical protein PGTUg99_013060 [Puccinia graminis f. sp. tritici]KAA1115082.1 hypothetical protein PGT21_031003 [Puccinia graminis f. sp. tritici]KAA1127254.1 hypothetical protein PGTUg99_033140 [Puccinia graminis f. sp. tritici]